MNSSEKPINLVSVAESAPSNDELIKMHVAHYKTSVDNVPPSIVEVDSSAACQSEVMCADKTAKQADSTLPYSKYTPGSTKDDNGLCSAGTTVDLIDTSQDNLNVDSSQAHSLSEDFSHLSAALQSNQPGEQDVSNQPGEQDVSENSRFKYGSEEKQMKTDETLHEIAGDCRIYSRAYECSHDTDLGRYSPSSDACSTQGDCDALGSQVTAVEVHAAMKTDDAPETHDALPTQSEKEVSEVEVSTNVHNDHGSHVSCEDAMVRMGSDNPTLSHTYDSNNTNEDANDSIDTKQQPKDKTSASLLQNSDLNQQSCTLQFEDDPPTTTLAATESDKTTGDADIISSGIEIETVGIQQTEEAPTGRELTVASHTEELVEQTQEASVPNKEEIIDSVVLKQDCNTEPCGDAAVSREVTEEMDHSTERPVSELALIRAELTEICGPKVNESVLAAGLENDCSGLKHDDSSTSSEHVVAPEPINETSVMQVEHEETEKEGGYCTVADSGPSSKAIMELVAQEETPAVEANETFAGVEICKDHESHDSDEVVISVQSSDPNSASAIQPDTLNINTQFPVLIESSENKLSGSDNLYDTEQQIKMDSAAAPSPTSTKEITQGN
jgi:hypothetical protein